MKVVGLPWADRLAIVTKLSITRIRCSTVSPRRQTKPPAVQSRCTITALTRSSRAPVSARAHMRSPRKRSSFFHLEGAEIVEQMTASRVRVSHRLAHYCEYRVRARL